MEFITKNRQMSITIKPAPIKSAANLKKSIAKCLLSAGIIKDLNFQGLNLSALLDKAIEVLFSVETSDEFERACFECLKSCHIDKNGVKMEITPELFDNDIDLREDYYEILSNCIEVNMRPFFKSLVTEFKTRFVRTDSSQSQESPQTLNA